MTQHPFHQAIQQIQSRARTFFPEIEPFRHGMLAVSERHSIYWEQCGNPQGKPVIMLHGGPGGGCPPTMRRFHNPEKYCITLFDQRGAGRSLPYADCAENTTWDLVADIEKLREHLNIEKWQVFGGSWGSTLSLAYSVTHPERCTEVVLRGIFLLRALELRFFYQEGASRVFPEAFEPYLEHIPVEERDDLIKAYNKRLFSDDEKTRLAAACAWSTWEGATSFAVPPPKLSGQYQDPAFALAFARIENHYFVNKGFFPTENFLLENAHKLKDIPVRAVHGRYDQVCCVQNAVDLKKALPSMELHIAPLSGHSSSDPDILSHLISFTEEFAESK